MLYNILILQQYCCRYNLNTKTFDVGFWKPISDHAVSQY